MVALQLTREQQPRNKELDTVWIDCPRVLPVLRKALEEQAETIEYVDGERPPRTEGDPDPSLIVVCLDDREDVAKEIKQLRALAAKTPILAFSSKSSSLVRVAEEALRSGASGFVHAGMRPERIALAIASVANDVALIPRELLGEVLGRRLFVRLPRFLDP